MKVYNSEFDKLYEKLSKLFESDSDDEIEISTNLSASEKQAAADAFWASTKTDLIDIIDFHKAYGDDFSDEFKENNFDYNEGGLLKARWTYGDIKALDQSLPSTKAVKKLWAMQFVDHKKTKIQLDNINRARQEAEAQKKAAEEARAKEIADKNSLFQSHLNMKVINRVLEISTDPEDILPYYGGGKFYYVHGKTGITTDDYLRAAKYCNTYYEGRMNELEAELDYSRCSWYKPFMEWCKGCKSKNSLDYYRFIFQDKAGKIYVPISDNGWEHYTPDILSRLKALSAPIDVDLVSVDFYSESSSSYTYQSSYSYRYASISNKANAEVINKIGLKVKPMSSFNTYNGFEFFGDDSGWKEIPKEEAMKCPRTFFIDGMDKWFERDTEYYPTD